MTHQHRTLLFLLLILLVGSLAIVYYTRPEPVAVRIATVDRGVVEKTLANTRAGTVKACRRASLSPSIGGQIDTLAVREGERVKAGQLLLELWNRDLRAEVELAVRKAEVAKAQAKATCLNAEVARREADRLVKLQRKKVASVEETDKAVTLASARQAECEAADASARVDAARIEVARARLQRTQLFAPFSGVVAEITGELSEFVTPSPIGVPTPPAIDLIDNSCFYVSAPIDEVDAPQVLTGQQARISLDAFAGRYFQGRVRRVADYVLDLAKQARTLDVEVSFTDVQDLEGLLAGYSADIEVILEVHPDTLRIPSEAVVEQDQVYVFLPDESRLVARKIETGLSNWDYTEVRKGLEEGEQVVTSVDREGVADGVRARLDTAEQ